MQVEELLESVFEIARSEGLRLRRCSVCFSFDKHGNLVRHSGISQVTIDFRPRQDATPTDANATKSTD